MDQYHHKRQRVVGASSESPVNGVRQKGEPSAWSRLPPELRERIARHLHPCEIGFILRVVDKDAAKQFSSAGSKLAYLSEPIPPAVFADRWGKPDAMRELSLQERHDFLGVVAMSGNVSNLALACSVSGCTVPPKVLLQVRPLCAVSKASCTHARATLCSAFRCHHWTGLTMVGRLGACCNLSLGVSCQVEGGHLLRIHLATCVLCSYPVIDQAYCQC